MAVYNELQVGRYVRFLQKFLGIKGRQPAPLAFTGEIGAFWSLFHGAENRYLEGWALFGVGGAIGAGGAGNISVGRIRNLPGSNVVAVLMSLVISTNVNDQLALSCGAGVPAQADLTTVQTPISIDPRFGGIDSSNAHVSVKNNSVTTVAEQIIYQNYSLASTSVELIPTDIDELPLLPGSHYDFGPVTANEPMGFGLIWRERAMEESELK